MKKVLFAILVLACIAGMSSCTKKCYCSVSVDGKEIAGTKIDNDSGKPCSDIKYNLAGVQAKCRPAI